MSNSTINKLSSLNPLSMKTGEYQARVARYVSDKRLLRITRRFLEAGMMWDGVSVERHEGTPEGGPLSPLLANQLLDDLDKELECRGHRFCRYADDCNIYVGTQKAGDRVLRSVTRFLEEELRLQVNLEKSAAAPVQERQFVGYRILRDGRPQTALCTAETREARQAYRRAFAGPRSSGMERLDTGIVGKRVVAQGGITSGPTSDEYCLVQGCMPREPFGEVC